MRRPRLRSLQHAHRRVERSIERRLEQLAKTERQAVTALLNPDDLLTLIKAAGILLKLFGALAV